MAKNGHLIAIALGSVVLTACAGPRIEREVAGRPQVAACVAGYEVIDRAVEAAGVRDAEAYRMPGFPYLRASRFLASFRERELSPDQFEAWVDRLAALDREGRAVELMNLPAEARDGLDTAIATRVGPGWDAAEVVEACPAVLRTADLASAAGRDQLRAAVAVPPGYSMLSRTLGLYPLSAIPIAIGYERFVEDYVAQFEDGVVAAGAPVLYAPATDRPPLAQKEIAELLATASQNPLDIPEVEGEDLARLAATFAPAFLVDVASAADRIGHPEWGEEGLPGVDVTRPAAFVRLAHAWFEDRVVAQLVYLIWFEARPKTGALDILGGRLDGLLWRVTLDRDGAPLVYDTIHPCGCYHFFFPAAEVSRRPMPQDEPSDVRERVLVPERAPSLAAGGRLIVELAAGSHYVIGLSAGSSRLEGPPTEAYRLIVSEPIPDAPLRSMPGPGGGRRSLYGPDGLVPGTERTERFLFWPMGVASAGAMRQWGHHATAFIGERHFDDPDLLDRAFAR